MTRKRLHTEKPSISSEPDEIELIQSKASGDLGDLFDSSDSDSDSDRAEESSEEEESEESDDEEEDSDEQPTKSDSGQSEPSGETKENSGNALIQATKPDEYEYDSSDEEDIRNTIGNIPINWYADHDHVGYDLDGRRIIKSWGKEKRDELDEFLRKMEDPDYWRTVRDPQTGQDVVLSAEDVEIIKNIQRGRFPQGEAAMGEYIPYFTQDEEIHPTSSHPPQKRSFIPSKLERDRVSRMVHAIKMGWLRPPPPKEDEYDLHFFDLWGKEDPATKRLNRIPAPKVLPPGHEESYNPPPEYLFTEEERAKWEAQEPEERRVKIVPQKYSALRLVPAYKTFINERFERCLDLYLCPRQRKLKVNVNPEDLLPKLPRPRDLQPFPTTLSLVYQGHTDMVRTISVSPCGQWFASGSDDGSVRFWEVATGRCLRCAETGSRVHQVAWNPNQQLCLVAIANDEAIFLFNPALGDRLVVSKTDKTVDEFTRAEDDSGEASPIRWEQCSGEQHKAGFRMKLIHPQPVRSISWHHRGDYMVAVSPSGSYHGVVLHQLSRRRSQCPFKRTRGLVQRAMFHPSKPLLFIATQRYVRVYDLAAQMLRKRLMTNCRWVSSMDIHPCGDHVIVGSYDCRLTWFDLDLSTKPYQTLRNHKQAIRQVNFHRKYPLFASASDDGSVIVSHGMVYNDLLQNPLLVPVKILRGHVAKNDLGALDCQFHPSQPWIFTSGADATIRLYTN